MKLSIKTILFGTFAIVGLLVIAQGGFSLRSLGAVDAAIEGIYTDQLPSVINAEGMKSDLQRIRLAEGAHILASTDDDKPPPRRTARPPRPTGRKGSTSISR